MVTYSASTADTLTCNLDKKVAFFFHGWVSPPLGMVKLENIRTHVRVRSDLSSYRSFFYSFFLILNNKRDPPSPFYHLRSGVDLVLVFDTSPCSELFFQIVPSSSSLSPPLLSLAKLPSLVTSSHPSPNRATKACWGDPVNKVVGILITRFCCLFHSRCFGTQIMIRQAFLFGSHWLHSLTEKGGGQNKGQVHHTPCPKDKVHFN